MKSRLLRALLLALLVGGGVLFYRTTLRPDRQRLSQWAVAALEEIFGPDLSHGEVEADLLEGVRIRALRVVRAGESEPTLWADEVVVRHDALALSAGVLRLRRVEMRGPRISTHETDDGEIELDFTFIPPRDSGTPASPPPALDIRGGTFRLRANAASKIFRPGYTLVLGSLDATATPDGQGGVALSGGFRPLGIGMDEADRITFEGHANPEKGTLELVAVWDRLRLTSEVKGILAKDLLERLATQRLIEGPHRLGVRLARDPEVESGRLRLAPWFEGTARMDISSFPGAETIDARTREQINELLGKIRLEIEVSGGTIDVRSLTTSLAGGAVKAAGKIEDGGEVVDLDIEVSGLEFDDPALLKALGPISDRVLSEFRIAGSADAKIGLRRERGGPFRWDASIDLVDATVVVLGSADPVRKTPAGHPLRYGFPYAIEHAFGRIYANPEGVTLDAIEGRHGAAWIRLRGASERSRSGGPTGTVRWVEGDAEVLLTVEARNVPVDRDLEEAVEGSELAGFLDRYRLSGVIDRILLDVVKRPHLDATVAVEIDVDLDHDGLVYAPLPIPLTEVKGRVSLLQPPLEAGGRGREVRIAATGRAAGGEVSIEASLVDHERRGRVRVIANGVVIDEDLERAVLSSEAGTGELGATWRFLRPRGRADVDADLPAYDDPDSERWKIALRGTSIRIGGAAEDEGVTMEDLTGTLLVLGKDIEVEGVAGRIGTGTVAIDGRLAGGPLGRWDLRVDAKALHLTRGVLGAILSAAPCESIFPPGITVEPGGRLDLRLTLARRPLDEECVMTAGVDVRDADLTARIGDLSMRVRGAFSVQGDDVRLEGITAEGQGVSIEIPRARIDEEGLEGEVTLRLSDVEVTAEVLGLLPASLRPTFSDVTKDRRLQATDLSAVVDEHGAMTIRGALGLKAAPDAPAGGSPRGLVEFAPLVVTAPGEGGRREVRGTILLRDLELDLGTRLEEARGSLDIAGIVLGDDPTGRATLRLDAVRVVGLLLRDLTVPIDAREGLLRVGPVAGDLYGGRLTGEVGVHTRAPVAFEGRLRVRGMSLGLLRQDLRSGPDLSGRAFADVEFQSRSPSFRDFTAAGTIGVREGDLGDLPAIATLPALFANVVPRAHRPTFERADATFTIEEEVVHAKRIALAGPLFSTEGFGTLDFSGNLDVTLTPQFLKSLLLPGALDVPGFGDFLGLFREDPLYVVVVRGTLHDAKPDLVPLPFLSPRRGAPEVRGTPFLGRPTRRIPGQFR